MHIGFKPISKRVTYFVRNLEVANKKVLIFKYSVSNTGSYIFHAQKRRRVRHWWARWSHQTVGRRFQPPDHSGHEHKTIGV